MFKKVHFEIVGKAMLGAAKYHLSKKELYLAVGAVGIGAGLADKSVQSGIKAGVTTVIGIVGYSGMNSLSSVREQIITGAKVEDI